MVEIIATLVGAAIIFGLGLWSTRMSQTRSKGTIGYASSENRQTIKTESVIGNEELDRNKINPASREMAASGNKN